LNKRNTRQIILSLLLILTAALAHLPWLDTLAEEYTEQGLERTLLTYAVSRSLNGVISVAQGTEVAVSPAGIGLTFAPGQILDPINDLIERFSWVVLVSSTSLGIQRLLLEITATPIISWLLTLMLVISVFRIWFYKPLDKGLTNWPNIINKVLIILIVIRFIIPVIAITNEGLYLNFMQPKYEVAQAELEQASDQIQLINQDTRGELELNDEDKGIFEKAENWLNQTQQSLDVDKQMQSLKTAAADISKQVINMIVIFVVQSIIFPLMFLWMLIKITKYSFRQFEL